MAAQAGTNLQRPNTIRAGRPAEHLNRSLSTADKPSNTRRQRRRVAASRRRPGGDRLGPRMHIAFVGETDDGLSPSAHHAMALRSAGWQVTFDHLGERLAGPHLDGVHLITHGQSDDRLMCNVLAARSAQIPVLRFWTGPDLVWAEFHEPSRMVAQALAHAGVCQYCRTESARERLAALSIAAETAPIVSAHLSAGTQPHPLPQQFTALCHLPSSRREFCGGAVIDSLIRWLPRVRFIVLGDRLGDYSAFKNVESLGLTDNVVRQIQRSTVALHARLDREPSRLMLESLALGRHVIANCPWPHCHFADSLDKILAAVRALQRDLTFNLAGREAVCREHDYAAAACRLRGMFEQAASAGIGANLPAAWQASVAACRFSSLGPKTFPPSDPASLPPQADALRALIQPRAAQPQGASA